MRAKILTGYITLVTLMMVHIAQTSDDGHWHILIFVGASITALWVWLGLRLLQTESKPPFTKDKDRPDEDLADP